MKNYRLLIRHSKTCFAVKNVLNGTWDHAWFLNAMQPVVSRDKLGRANNGGYTTWLQFICNCSQCPGLLIVRQSAVRELFQADTLVSK